MSLDLTLNFWLFPLMRIEGMAMRLAVILLFLYSTPIISAVQPVPDEPDAARERLMSFIED